MQYQVLVVDDEIDLAKMTAEYLQMFDITTACAFSAAECYEFFAKNEAELILLDINLGDGSGFAVCKKLREEYNLPILFISARQSDDDVLAALTIGGDDYIKKPYSLSVLLAKVKVNLKRVAELRAAGLAADGRGPEGYAAGAGSAANGGAGNAAGAAGYAAGAGSAANGGAGNAVGAASYAAGAGSAANGGAGNAAGAAAGYAAGAGSVANGGAGNTGDPAGSANAGAALALDAATMSAVRFGRKIPLKAKEFALLNCLYEHRNTIVTKEVLFTEVWGDTFYSDGTLNVHIRKLREKLEDDSNAPKMIKTVWGTGYILEI